MTGRVRPLSCLLFLWALVLWLSVPVLAGDQGILMPHADRPILDLTYGQLLLLIVNLGLGVIIFAMWVHDVRRMTSSDALLDRYDQSQAAHLQSFETISRTMTEAFRQINDRNTDALTQVMADHRALTEEVRDVILLDVQGNAQLKEILKQVLRAGGKV